MPEPLDPLVADMVNRLDGDLREAFEERAGIIEFDGQVSRACAECLALLGVLDRYPEALLGVVALQVDVEGEKRWMLATDLDAAQQKLTAVGGTVVRAVDLADVLREHPEGTAYLVKTTK